MVTVPVCSYEPIHPHRNRRNRLEVRSGGIRDPELLDDRVPAGRVKPFPITPLSECRGLAKYRCPDADSILQTIPELILEIYHQFH